jgi:hypothetical protein
MVYSYSVIIQQTNETIKYMGRRSAKDWGIKFKCVKLMMTAMDSLTSKDEIKAYSVMMRNPLVFDNNVADVHNHIPYNIGPLKGKTTNDHLIGMSNIVLYIYEKGLHRKWETVKDFMNTLKALNTLIPVTVAMNSNKVFKKGWQFDSDNIDECIKWGNKLKSVGVTELVCNKTGEIKSVDIVWGEWYTVNKEYLL